MKNERKKMMSAYPLYDVPWLVREPNGRHRSARRHEIEVRNQAVVDDYFILRDRGATSQEAREAVASKHQLTVERTDRIIRWFYEEAKKRRKYDFLEKFSPLREQITDF